MLFYQMQQSQTLQICLIRKYVFAANNLLTNYRHQLISTSINSATRWKTTKTNTRRVPGVAVNVNISHKEISQCTQLFIFHPRLYNSYTNNHNRYNVDDAKLAL